MTRRGNGEGTIVRRQDCRWAAAVSLPSGGRKWIYGRTRKDVADRMAKVLSELQRGMLPPPENLTVGDLLKQWLEEGAHASVRSSTYRSYADIVKLHLEPELGRVRLVKLQPSHVERLLKRKLDSGLSPRRVEYIRAVLRRALNRALRWGLVGRNVATLVDAPRVVRPEVQPFTQAEVKAFLRAIRGDRLEALYVLALSAGLRQGELLGLRWQDVDTKGATLTVRRSLQRVNGRFEFVEPKSARSRRTVALPKSAAEALEHHEWRQGQERRAAGRRWENHDLVFASALGRPLDGTNMTHRFQKLLADAKLPRRRFHDLRHSCATLLLAQGVPARVVMEILGHSQISVTMNTYSHVLPEVQREAADRMDSALRGQEPDEAPTPTAGRLLSELLSSEGDNEPDPAPTQDAGGA